MCVHVRLGAFTCIRMCLCVCVCAQKIKHLDTSRHKKSLRPDASFVQGLSRCTIFRSPKKKYCGKKDYLDAQHNVQLSKGSTSLVYADDILLFKPLSSPSDMQELQDDVHRICEWISSNHLTINVAKSKLIDVHHQESLQQAEIYNLSQR